MHRKEFDIQARRLTRCQDKFVTTMYMTFEVLEKLTDNLKSFRGYLDAVQEVMDAHAASSKALIDAHEAVLKAFTESSVTIHENSERIEKLIAKVDSYFGSTPGLDYDN
jgi:hypothetical protein